MVDASAEEAKNAGSCVPTGFRVIEQHVETMASNAGVYRMVARGGEVLYVGKAKNLRKRVTSYTHPERLGLRLRRMVAETASMEVVTTRTEAEALLLEANLIKRLRPRYNILLRDDKSFPLILVTADHAFPQVLKHRGARSRKGRYFGPFASAWAVNQTLTALQRAFLLRSCSDSVFAVRSRPCLLYQIKRCSAPCVGLVSAAEYGELVDEAQSFLRGDSQSVQRALAMKMEAASGALEFESAARYRDRIRAMAAVQSHQDINLARLGDADIIAAHRQAGQTGIQVFFFRAGRNYGNRAYYPNHAADDSVEAVLEAFLGQFYSDKPPPRLVLVSHRLPEQALVAEALSVHAGRRVQVAFPQRGDKLSLVAHALQNAREALGRRVAENASQRRQLDALAGAFDLDGPPERIEVYDNSHGSGREAVGAMIVSGPEGFMKNAYRKWTIKSDITPGDDYAMMREVLSRRFGRALKEDPDRSSGQWPDLVLIDGGAGQLGAAIQVFQDLGIDDVPVAAIAKGPDRNAGRERIFLQGRDPWSPVERDPLLHFLQRLRDEAHRFAIGGHRAKRAKRLSSSPLDEIPGIGAHRKKSLLHHFGSAAAVARAGRSDLEAVTGISRSTANRIYDWFHGEG